MESKLFSLNDQGKPVDWWFMYKIAGKSKMSNGAKALGTEYVYFDSDMKQGATLALSSCRVSDTNKGALANTLNQVYQHDHDPAMGWFFYNDEDPVTGKTNSSRGHTKGVLCFDLSSDTAFWLIHSAPKFPPGRQYGYPDTATGNAQTFLCISLKNADTAKSIAGQMVLGQQPNVYLSSAVPKALENQPDDPRVQLIKNQVIQGGKPYGNFISFPSRAGSAFRSVAKNKEWSSAGGSNFYNDLVGPMLKESLDVETWEHGKEPGNVEADKIHHIMAMKSVDLAPLGINPSYLWSEENDHAKLVISMPGERNHFICVGDINFTRTMENRSGGTVAFQQNDLWKSLVEILSEVNIRNHRPGGNSKGT